MKNKKNLFFLDYFEIINIKNYAFEILVIIFYKILN